MIVQRVGQDRKWIKIAAPRYAHGPGGAVSVGGVNPPLAYLHPESGWGVLPAATRETWGQDYSS